MESKQIQLQCKIAVHNGSSGVLRMKAGGVKEAVVKLCREIDEFL